MNKSINSIKDDILEVYYKSKKYSINITKELEINPAIINNQLETSPSNYAFLCLIRDRYTNKLNRLFREKENAYNNSWIFYKESGSMSNDLVDKKASIQSKYLSISNRYDKLSYKVNVLNSICKAYESRERILQTISANIRKQ